jgi:hypothetical protein
MSARQADWTELNQRYLLAALAEVRAALERHAAATEGGELVVIDSALAEASLAPDAGLAEWRPALEVLCATFGLSPFERGILLLCAGVELEAQFAGLCARAAGDPTRPWPTFSLAMAALPDPHWSALTPSAPLRHWRLIEVSSQANVPLTLSPLRIDERILNFLTGIQHLDDRLVGLVEPVSPAHDLAPSQQIVAQSIANQWANAGDALALQQLCGADEFTRRAVAAAGCARAGLHCFALAADAIPTNAAELEGFIRLWEREAALTATALYVDAEAVEKGDAHTLSVVTRLLERIRSPLLLSTRDRWRPLRRPLLSHDVRKPTTAEQREIWQQVVGEETADQLNGQLERIVAQFNLSGPAIRSSVSEARAAAADDESFPSELWQASRLQARSRLDDLAQRIEPIARWTDLVLPAAELRQLREVTAHVTHRRTVYEAWGFGAVSSRGLGISALFAGTSGTGKTMAAEVLANALSLDLYRIDLSSVVSKYIGETEKNLRRVFEAAEDGGAILFFDEADALFGKRSEVKDSHDRYANIEINYLLQRMESYCGLAVLATNRKGDLDPAFLRRIRFVINFPFPDDALRAEIWRGIFPPHTPVADLDVSKLARLSVAGGNIRNIALHAAFLAADACESVTMKHLLRAARTECAKLEKPISEAEIGGWV